MGNSNVFLFTRLKKTRRKGRSKKSLKLFCKIYLRDLPDEGESVENLVAKHGEKNVNKKQGKRDDIFCKPSMNKEEFAEMVESLAAMVEKDANLRQVLVTFLTTY